MVFDIRGTAPRRQIRLRDPRPADGASLFLVVGPVNIASLFESSNNVSTATKQFEEQAARIEAQTEARPRRRGPAARPDQGADQRRQRPVDTDSETGRSNTRRNPASQLEKASEAWAQYLKAPTNRAPAVPSWWRRPSSAWRRPRAQRPEIEANIKAAAAAQQSSPKPADPRRLSTLAIYRYFAFDYKGAEEARKKAATFANTKFDGKTSATNSTRPKNGRRNSRNSSPKPKRKPRKPRPRANRASASRSPKATCSRNRRSCRVGREGLEPSTLSLRGSCSNQLS